MLPGPTSAPSKLAALMLLAGIFGIHNRAISTAVELVLLFLVVVYCALIFWTFMDARRRIADPWIVAFATIAALFPYVGVVVYMILRPPEYLDDVRERELEMQAAEARLAERGFHLCPHCDSEVEKDFLRCPNCMRKLKDPGPTCGNPLDPLCNLCPYWETVMGAIPAPTPRGRRRRESAASEQPVAGTAEHGSSSLTDL